MPNKALTFIINAKKDDFDQQTACKAPVRWSKYTAGIHRDSRVSIHDKHTPFSDWEFTILQ